MFIVFSSFISFIAFNLNDSQANVRYATASPRLHPMEKRMCEKTGRMEWVRFDRMVELRLISFGFYLTPSWKERKIYIEWMTCIDNRIEFVEKWNVDFQWIFHTFVKIDWLLVIQIDFRFSNQCLILMVAGVWGEHMFTIYFNTDVQWSVLVFSKL